MSLVVAAASGSPGSPGSPVFTHGVSYQLLLGNYGATCTQMSGTVTNNANNQLTGDVTIFLSAVPTEYLNEDLSTAGTGYTFSYFSSSAPVLGTPDFIDSSGVLQPPSPRELLSNRTSPEYLWPAVCGWSQFLGWRCADCGNSSR